MLTYQCVLRCGIGRHIAISAFLGVLFAASHMHAQAMAWPSVSAPSIGTFLYIEKHPALGDAIVKRAESRVDRMFWTLLGTDTKLLPLDLPKMETWLETHDLEQLTVEQWPQLGCDAVDKAILLEMRMSGNTYRLAAAEFDRHFNTISTVQRVDVMQRSIVPDSLGRLALRCWSPVGVILGREHNQYIVEFKDHSHLADLAQWSHLESGSPLQLYREVQQSDGILQQREDDQFLTVRDITRQKITATPAMITGQDTWFRYLGHRQARYLVRLLDSEPGPVAVRVVVEKTEQPRQGCKVFLSKHCPKSTDDLGLWKGVTDYDGHVEFATKDTGLHYVSVRYGRHVLTKAFVPQHDRQPLKFTVPQREDVTALDAGLAGIEDRIHDKAKRINTVHEQIEDAIAAGDIARTDRLVEEARKLSNTTDLEKELERLKAASADKGGSITTAVEQMVEVLNELQKGVRRAQEKHDQLKRAARLKKLRTQIEAAWAKYEWHEAERLLTECVTLDPSDKKAQDALDKLRKGLASNNAEHQAAQQTARNAANITTIDELLKRWDELNHALLTLLDNKDELHLLRTRDSINNWVQLIRDETQRVQNLSANNPSLSAKEATDLQTRIDALKKITAELPQTATKIDAILTQGQSSSQSDSGKDAD